MSSSPISAALEQLDLPAGDRALLAGTTNFAAACRSHARDATRVLAALGLSAP